MGCLASGVLASVFQIGPDFHQIVLCWVIHFVLSVLVCASPRLQLTSCAAVIGSRAWPSVYSAGAAACTPACARACVRQGVFSSATVRQEAHRPAVLAASCFETLECWKCLHVSACELYAAAVLLMQSLRQVMAASHGHFWANCVAVLPIPGQFAVHDEAGSGLLGKRCACKCLSNRP